MFHESRDGAGTAKFVVGVCAEDEYALEGQYRREIGHRFNGFAGLPTTVVPAGTSRITTAPVPMTASSPTVSLLLMALLGATHTFAATRVLPPIIACAMRSAPSPMSQLCAT